MGSCFHGFYVCVRTLLWWTWTCTCVLKSHSNVYNLVVNKCSSNSTISTHHKPEQGFSFLFFVFQDISFYCVLVVCCIWLRYVGNSMGCIHGYSLCRYSRDIYTGSQTRMACTVYPSWLDIHLYNL